MTTVVATFLAGYPPYVAGDAAGIGRDLAVRLRDRGIVRFDDPAAVPALDFDALDRAGLVALARARLGVDEEPPAEVTDDELRASLRDALGGAGAVPPAVDGGGAPGWDRLDVMDRAHLEAFARTRCCMGAIDPEMDDAELRRQIRATAAASLSGGAPAAAVRGSTGRAR